MRRAPAWPRRPVPAPWCRGVDVALLLLVLGCCSRCRAPPGGARVGFGGGDGARAAAPAISGGSAGRLVPLADDGLAQEAEQEEHGDAQGGGDHQPAVDLREAGLLAELL